MAILLVNDPLPHLSFQKFAPDQRLTDWVQCYWKIGSTTTQDYGVTGANYYVIDTVVRITGYTTGYRMDIPIKVLKKSN